MLLKQNIVSIDKQDVPKVYQDLCEKNGLLQRIEASLKLKGWTDLEIRTAQLEVAVRSNQSLQQRIKELSLKESHRGMDIR